MHQSNYPFLKLTTDEKFPRLLMTRRPDNKKNGQNIYGAFLPKPMARRLIDLLARIFRLRPCELDINGDFDAPCPEYFLHRCLAPCVAEICDRAEYLESVEIVHLLLSNRGTEALGKIDLNIERFAGEMKYERAAEWRDARLTIEEILTNAKWQIAASTMTDVITLTVEENAVQLHLTTLRRGKTVGKLYFQFETNKVETILENFLTNFYQLYAPKQIYVPIDFQNRKNVEKFLSEKFSRKIQIIFQQEEKLPPSIIRARYRASQSFQIKNPKNSTDRYKLSVEIKRLFNLKTVPQRIECFDVAHLAGKEIVASRITAIDGKLQREEDLVWEFENMSETAALAAAVETRIKLLAKEETLPEIILIDGGTAQINAVLRVLKKFNLKNLNIVGAVKPPQAHNRISHFLTAEKERIEFEKRSEVMNFFQTLRDAAHTLANETHRKLHSLVQIFKNNENAPQIKYLLVPIRYAERGGNADDLTPIRSITQAGEIILKTKSKKRKLK